MNITIIAPGLNQNRGGERVIFIYAQGLVKFGNDVTIIVPQKTAHLQDENIRILEYKSILPSFWSRQMAYLDAIRPAFKMIPKNTDIIIGTYTPQLIISTIYKLLNKNVKYLMLNQDFSEMFKNRYERKLMFKLYPRYTDKIISISKFCADEIEKSSNKTSVIIPNGIEDYYLNQTISKNKTKDYIFWLGSKNKHKGYQEFLEAMQIVWKEYPNIKLKTTIEAKKLKNVEVVKINGNFDMLKNLYQNALMFVCSSYQEGFGLPALEAMSSGCPVVTTDTGGCMEYAVAGYNSLIVKSKNAKVLADAIIQLIEDSELRQKLAENGYKTAQNYDWNTSQIKLYEVIRKL